jgi:multimeric flavodoxin WrbA
MRKIVGIAGSPRREGNSTTLLKAVLDGAASSGATSKVFHLNELLFRGCQACSPCTQDATCRIQDDLTPALEALREADVWVLAAPIYFCGVSGQMKLFFDRCFHLTCEGERLSRQLPGKRAAAIIVTYEDKCRDDYRDRAQRMAKYLGWMGDFDPAEVLSCGELGPANAASERPELLRQATKLGAELIKRLDARE